MNKKNKKVKNTYVEQAEWYTLSCERLGTKINQIDSISKKLCQKYNPHFDASHKIIIDFVENHGQNPTLKMKYYGKVRDVLKVIETVNDEFNIYFDTIN